MTEVSARGRREDITRSSDPRPLERRSCGLRDGGGERRAVGDGELVEYVAKVRVDRVRRDVKAAGHVPVCQPFCDELRYRAFGGGETFPPLRRPASRPACPAPDTKAPQLRAYPSRTCLR